MKTALLITQPYSLSIKITDIQMGEKRTDNSSILCNVYIGDKICDVRGINNDDTVIKNITD